MNPPLRISWWRKGDAIIMYWKEVSDSQFAPYPCRSKGDDDCGSCSGEYPCQDAPCRVVLAVLYAGVYDVRDGVLQVVYLLVKFILHGIEPSVNTFKLGLHGVEVLIHVSGEGGYVLLHLRDLFGQTFYSHIKSVSKILDVLLVYYPHRAVVRVEVTTAHFL